MHELGIVFHVIDTVNEIIEENKVAKVNSVTVEIGEVSLVIPSYFEDCWKWAVGKQTTPIHDARIVMETIPAVTYCEGCEKTYETVKYGKICPYCGSEHTYLLQGNEFNIKELEVE